MSDIKRRVFLSWSGEASRRVAAGLRDWLPQVLQNTMPFMSEEDIAKGSRPGEAIALELRQAAVGIICLTPDNLQAPWVLFEAGALSNSLKAKELVCPFLIGLRKIDIAAPLSAFQLTDADHDDTLRLVRVVNESFDPEFRMKEAALERQFDMWWPELEAIVADAIRHIARSPREVPRRSQEDLLAEVLEVVRRIERSQPPEQRQLEFGDYPLPVEDEAPRLRKGERVRHPQFGSGTIRDLTGSGQDLKALIDFDTLGRKRVIVRYANLAPAQEE